MAKSPVKAAGRDGADNPLVVAVDDGYAQIKIVGGSPVPGGPLVCRSIRSSARHGTISSVSGGGAVATYETDDGATRMTVSDEVSSETTMFDGFHTSAMNRILIAHALSEAGYGGIEGLNIWAGLPVGDYFKRDKSGQRNDALMGRKIANLRVPVRSLVPHAPACPTYGDIRIGCQAISAFIDYAVGDDFQPKDVPVERVAVVDIGGRTTDIALVLGGQRCDPLVSETRSIGVLDVHAALERNIQMHFDVSDSYSRDFLDKAVRTGKARLWGSDADVSELLSQAKAITAQKLMAFVEQRLGNASDLDAVVFVGGGANLFADAATMYRNAVVPSEPEFANVRGMYKFSHL